MVECNCWHPLKMKKKTNIIHVSACRYTCMIVLSTFALMYTNCTCIYRHKYWKLNYANSKYIINCIKKSTQVNRQFLYQRRKSVPWNKNWRNMAFRCLPSVKLVESWLMRCVNKNVMQTSLWLHRWLSVHRKGRGWSIEDITDCSN